MPDFEIYDAPPAAASGGFAVYDAPPGGYAVPAGERPGPQHIPGPDGRPVGKTAPPKDRRSFDERERDKLNALPELLATALTATVFGAPAGAARGFNDLIVRGGRRLVGRPDPGARPIDERMMEAMQDNTYAPRSPEAQDILRNVGGLLEATKLPMDPALPAAASVGRLPEAARQGATVARSAVPAAAADARAGLRAPGMFPPREGPAMAGGGAALTEAAAQARATAEGLPVPVPITAAEASRDQPLLRRQGELAKDDSAAGRLIRDNNAEANRAIAQNFDALVDGLGAVTTESPERLGEMVSGRVLTAGEQRLKARHRATYAAANQAGHMAEQIDTTPLVRWIETNRSSETMAPIVGMMEKELTRLSGARKMPNGELTPLRLGINDIEELRKLMVSNAKGGNLNDQRLALAANAVIDNMTEGKGGELYRQARGEFREFANVYRNNGLVKDLLALKPNSTDRRVAYENVYNKIAVAPNDSIRHLFRTLESIGPEGADAAREIRAMTVREGMRRALGNTAMDEKRNIIPSPAKFNTWVNVMDRDGKLDLLAGRENAAVLRDLRETMLNVQTSPPGTLNSSGTWSLMREAFKELATGNVGPSVFAARGAFGALRKERADLRFAKDILPPQIPRGLQGAVSQP